MYVRECMCLPLQSTVQSHLVGIQLQFKSNLLESVEVFKHDMSSFATNYGQVRALLVAPLLELA